MCPSPIARAFPQAKLVELLAAAHLETTMFAIGRADQNPQAALFELIAAFVGTAHHGDLMLVAAATPPVARSSGVMSYEEAVVRLKERFAQNKELDFVSQYRALHANAKVAKVNKMLGDGSEESALYQACLVMDVELKVQFEEAKLLEESTFPLHAEKTRRTCPYEPLPQYCIRVS